MIDNTDLLKKLLFHNQIELEDAPFLSTNPTPLPEDWDFFRVEGMLLGLAVGDALGNTTEAMLPHERRQLHGEIRDYLPNRHAQMRSVGLPSDDSQMAFWTLEQLITDGGLVPEHLADKFTRHQIFGIGSSVRDFLKAYKNEGQSWTRAGQPSAGNGALMRIAPVLIPHLRQPTPALWVDAALAGMVTHNDRASNACCVAFMAVLWECLGMKQIPEPRWWVNTFTSAARQLEGNTQYETRRSDFPYQGQLWRFVEREVSQAVEENWPVIEAANRWHSGAYLLETMPCVLYILARYAGDPEEAIVRAVNDTKDNDTVAAIVGAALGALHGPAGLPERWVRDLLGRTGADDDGRVIKLIEQAKQTFWVENKPLSLADMRAILSFLPVFEQLDFKPGEWQTPPGTLGYFDYAPVVLEFLSALSKHNFIFPFDWPNWQEGKQLIEHPERIQSANLSTLRRLLTLHVRADRFSEGHLARVFETGQMVMILRRIAEIAEG